MKHRIATSALLSMAAILSATASGNDSADTVRTAIIRHNNAAWQTTSLPYSNPAINQFRTNIGLTDVSVQYDRTNHSGPINPQEGDGQHGFEAGANTYTKYKSSTLWGHGRYRNSTIKNVVWNECADLDLIYPYVSADSIGGDLKNEQYDFGAGYADHSHRWAWGMSLSYLATLQYRQVDPRPRNVAGTLNLAVGGAYRFAANYYGGLSFRLRKYKQTNDISFKSEMGVDKVYHLTGLGTHYNRFAGTGYSTYYDGYRYGVSADIYPADGRGAFASCLLSRFTFRNILTDLNKLPLASAWHNQLDAQAGWLAPGRKSFWSATAMLTVYRRHGTENIFGDATSAAYPQIGDNTLFADNCTRAGINGTYGLMFAGGTRVSVIAGGGWQRRTMAYIEPYQYTLTNLATTNVEIKADLALPQTWTLGLSAALNATMPFSCSDGLTPINPAHETAALQAIEHYLYKLETTRRLTPEAAFYAAHPVASRYTLMLSGRWARTAYAHGPHSDRFTCSVGVVF